MRLQKKTLIQCSVGLLVSMILIFAPAIKLPGLDKNTDAYFTQAITKASIAYATCRVINGSISVIKDSQLALEPAGIGLSLSVGQAVDPIDDMVERTSDVLVTSITSLGVQKLVYEISVSIVPRLLGFCLFLFSILILLPSEKIEITQLTLLKVMVVLVIVRLCLPLSSLANTYLNAAFFGPEIDSAKKELALGTSELDKLSEFTMPEIDGFRGTIEKSASFIKAKSVEFKEAYVSLISNAGSIIENLLSLTFLYVGMFLIQVMLLPILMFWLMAKTTNRLFSSNIPVLIRASELIKKDASNQRKDQTP
jgi:hypothetical protein